MHLFGYMNGYFCLSGLCVCIYLWLFLIDLCTFMIVFRSWMYLCGAQVACVQLSGCVRVGCALFLFCWIYVCTFVLCLDCICTLQLSLGCVGTL